jgi:hypothetical protein
MSKWTHSICDDCWNQKNPGREAVRVRTLPLETCCFCLHDHVSGIYVRGDPTTTPCKGMHDERPVEA